jgi:hypothetical protein
MLIPPGDAVMLDEPISLYPFNGRAFFGASDGVAGREL